MVSNFTGELFMTQNKRLLELLFDEEPHSAYEIFQKLRIWRVSARVFDLKQRGYAIKSLKDKEVPEKHWYQLITPSR